VAERVREIQ
jgi:hypothetical protein